MPGVKRNTLPKCTLLFSFFVSHDGGVERLFLFCITRWFFSLIAFFSGRIPPKGPLIISARKEREKWRREKLKSEEKGEGEGKQRRFMPTRSGNPAGKGRFKAQKLVL